MTIRAVIDDWIADFAPSYAAVAAGDRSAEEASAGLVVDVELPDDVCARRNEAVLARVVGEGHGDAKRDSQLRVLLEPTGDGRFNGSLIAVLPRERWRICGNRLADGRLLPADGTRGLQAPAPLAA